MRPQNGSRYVAETLYTSLTRMALHLQSRDSFISRAFVDYFLTHCWSCTDLLYSKLTLPIKAVCVSFVISFVWVTITTTPLPLTIDLFPMRDAWVLRQRKQPPLTIDTGNLGFI